MSQRSTIGGGGPSFVRRRFYLPAFSMCTFFKKAYLGQAFPVTSACLYQPFLYLCPFCNKQVWDGRAFYLCMFCAKAWKLLRIFFLAHKGYFFLLGLGRREKGNGKEGEK